jgi:hypothetical protein
LGQGLISTPVLIKGISIIFTDQTPMLYFFLENTLYAVSKILKNDTVKFKEAFR